MPRLFRLNATELFHLIPSNTNIKASQNLLWFALVVDETTTTDSHPAVKLQLHLAYEGATRMPTMLQWSQSVKPEKTSEPLLYQSSKKPSYYIFSKNIIKIVVCMKITTTFVVENRQYEQTNESRRAGNAHHMVAERGCG
jgi:hypothetical protein